MRLIRKLRERRGWTQQALASYAYCSKSTISNIECGFKKPTRDVLASCAKVLEWDGDPFALLDEVDE